MSARIAITLLALVVLAGCGQPSDTTPVACLEGEGAYLKALDAAPSEVKLRGETLISECLAENQKAGDLATVGTALVGVATELNAETRAEPGGDANLQLGYLLGAAQRGAEGTDGIHAELVRRLTAAARYSPDNRPPPAAFLRVYREGFDAGQAGG
jgi:FAD/FMN-containing dehydrogenase